MTRKIAVRNGLTDAEYLTLRVSIWVVQGGKCWLCDHDVLPPTWQLHHLDCNPRNNRRGNLAVLCTACHLSLHTAK